MSWRGFSSSAPTLSLEEVKQEIDALSDEAREKIDGEIFGTTKETVDESRFEASLRDFQTEIDLIPAADKTQFLQALERCPDYVNDSEFRLLFLRCDGFDAKAAARRMVTYWESKVTVFGEEHAFGPITATIAAREDDVALRMGGIRVLPKKATGDRGVIVVDRTRFDQRQAGRKNMLRLVWYMHHVALEDKGVQENGVVLLAGHPRRKTTLQEQDRKLDSLALRHIRNAIPVRICVVHHYVSSKILEYVVPVLLVLFGPSLRQRYVVHKGTEESYLSALDGYGIAKSILPKDMGGTDDYDHENALR